MATDTVQASISNRKKSIKDNNSGMNVDSDSSKADENNECIAENKEETNEERMKRVFALTARERAELPYRRISALSFIFVMIVFGVPLWWHRTSTYRVAFQNFPTGQQITVPVRVTILNFNRSLDEYTREVSSLLSNSLSSLPKIERLNMNFDVSIVNSEDNSKILEQSYGDEKFSVCSAVIDESEWKYPGYVSYFDSNYCAQILYAMDAEKLKQRLMTAITDVLLDTSHLTAIVRRDLRSRLSSAEIATLPASQQKRLIWDSATLSAEYIVQIIFLHSGGNNCSDDIVESEVVANARRFAVKLSEVIDISVSSEHLWDFDLAAWLKKDVQERWTIRMDDVSSIVTAVDQETSTVESSAPVLKFLIFDATHPITLLDYLGDDSSGFVVASWGALLSHCGSQRSSVSESLIAAMRVLFGLDTQMPPSTIRRPVPVAKWELSRLKLRSFIDSSINGISSVNAIHNLIAEIDNIVINDEVASQANQAVNLIVEALKTAEKTGEIDVHSVIEGRARAERALNDKSLLALLYFPNDQKFAIYLPLFLPTLLPLFGSMLALHKYWRGKE